jgi:hypothetical protein
MSTEERAAQIKANLHQDMHTTVVTNGLDSTVVDLLVDDAMFQIEHLLVEIEGLSTPQVKFR